MGRCHKGNKVRLYAAKLLNIENEHIKERTYSDELALTLLQYLQNMIKRIKNHSHTTPRRSYSILYSTAAAILELANFSVIQSPKSIPEVTPLAVIISP